MESVIVTLITIFLLIFAALFMGNALIASHDTVVVSWQGMQERYQDQLHSDLQSLDAYTASNGTEIYVTLYNTGSTRFTSYEDWDFFVHYYDAASPQKYHTRRLDYEANGLTDSNRWTVEGIYLEPETDYAEVFEPDIINPGEAIRLYAQLSPHAAAKSPLYLEVVAPQGSSSSTTFLSNAAPKLTTNTGIVMNPGESITLDETLLAATDADDPNRDLTFTLVTAPQQGELSHDPQFLQAELYTGDVQYTHTGTGDDQFTFTVDDNKDTSGPYTFTVIVNHAPELINNVPLELLANQSAVITPDRLMVTDADQLAPDLIYTVTRQPLQGSISAGDTFTQYEIDTGAVQYTHTGGGVDSFEFSVSDGYTDIGTFMFYIHVH